MAGAAEKQVRVQYFAILREQRGLSLETINTSASTLRQFYEELKEKHGFGLPCDRLRVAVDDQFQDWNDSLCDNSRIVLIPPVAGG